MKPEVHPDFARHEWCKTILTSADTEVMESSPQRVSITPSPSGTGKTVSNSMFTRTLYSSTANAIRAQVNFKQPARELEAITPDEYCILLSIGDGLDGLEGRAHGGFNALILDQVTGMVASMVGGSIAPATARLEVDYVREIRTPGIVLGRAWAVENVGRKTWVKAVIEDVNGQVLARGRALFIHQRKGKM